MKHYFPSTPPKEVKVEAEYNEGGGRTKRGLYIYLTLVKCERSPKGYVSETTEIFNGHQNYKVLALEMKRRNQKKLELLGKFLNGKAAEIARAYNAGDRERVAKIVAEFAA